MKQNTIPAKERIASSFKRLASASTDLNLAADELNETISALDRALEGLSLGVSAWHRIASYEDDQNGDFWTRDIGYARVRSRWRIALRKTWGNPNVDIYNEEEWPFAEAPRWMCIESVDKLPDLLDDLIARTEDATAKIKAKTTEARGLAAAIQAAAQEVRPKEGDAK